jgi:shikimate kinase
MNKVILIGFRCVGKTTIGKKLSEALNWDFLDLDEEIQKKTGKSIKELVEEKGWEYFRTLEKDEMKKLKKLKNVVIALGGGSVIHEKEMKNLFKESFVVWLWANPDVILDRIKEDEKTASQRPSLKNLDLKSEIEEVLKERYPLYEKFSHLRIDTDKFSVKEAVKKILEKMQEA